MCNEYSHIGPLQAILSAACSAGGHGDLRSQRRCRAGALDVYARSVGVMCRNHKEEKTCAPSIYVILGGYNLYLLHIRYIRYRAPQALHAPAFWGPDIADIADMVRYNEI